MILGNCKFYLHFSLIIKLAPCRIDGDNKEDGEKTVKTVHCYRFFQKITIGYVKS